MKTFKILCALLSAMFALAVQAQQEVDVHRSDSEAFRYNEADLKFQESSFPHIQDEEQELEMPQHVGAESPKHAPTRRIQLDENTLLCDSTITYNGDGSYSSKTIYTYDENGYKTSEASYYFRQGQWVGNSKKEYAHYQEGNLIIDASASYVWKDGQWVRSSLKEGIYDERENLLKESTWNWEGDKWVGCYLEQFAYDDRNNQTLLASYKWVNNEWVGEYKTEYAYDEHNNWNLAITYEWNNKEWVRRFKKERTYDKNNQLTQEIGYELKHGQWIQWMINTNFYVHEKKMGRIEVTSKNWQNGRWLEESAGFSAPDNQYVSVESMYKWEEDKMMEVYNSNSTPWDKLLDEELEMKVDAHWVGAGEKLEVTCHENTITTITYGWIEDECWWNGYQAVLEEGHWGLRGSSRKKEYTFNEYGDLTSVIEFVWRTGYGYEEPFWEVLEKYKWENTYDDHDNLVHKEKYQWKNSSWVADKWEEFIGEYIYDENDNLVSKATITGSFGSKIEYTYDANGKITGQAKYDWYNNQWVGAPTEGKWEVYYPKWEYTYDDNGNKIRYANYIWSNGQWITYKETLYTYDESAHLTSSISYQRANGEMTATTKIEYAYDEFGNETSQAHYVWSNGSWVGNNMYEYDYNELGYKTLEVFYRWQDDQWVINRKTVYYYLDEPKKEYSMKVLNKVVDILVGKESVEEEEMEKVDINGDGVISIGDVARVIYFLINEEDDEDEDKDKDKKE